MDMVKRVSFRTYWIAAFAIIVMMMCWESNKAQAALFDSTIPEQSIRLRILANSDAPNDQLVKMAIRDEVIRQMSGWVTEPDGITAARQAVMTHMAELEAVVGQILRQSGYDYGYTVELGQVPFPTKQYGSKVYPAGDYEALRITLGSGEGQNWWCVLFPPLCFVDGTTGIASAKAKPGVAEAASAKAQDKPQSKIQEQAQTQNQVMEKSKEKESEKKVEVKFFVWEMVKKIKSK
ncbi:MAG: spoIIR [Paenibacillus sp.]|jgi:stage II sporulation protein R|nr:spoIIR [Paenibacillus sp.]